MDNSHIGRIKTITAQLGLAQCQIIGFLALLDDTFHGAVCEQVLVLLLDVVVGECDVLPRREYQFHDFCVASHLLFDAAGEVLDFQVG